MMILVSLIGEQPIPNLLPIRRFAPAENLLVYTSRTEAVAHRLRRLISASDGLQDDLKASPYDIAGLRQALQTRLESREEIVFNLTGGTKTMVMAAYSLAEQRRCPFIYLESENRRSRLLHYFFQDGRPVQSSADDLPALITIQDYLNAHLHGYQAGDFHHDENGSLSDGGLFEQAVYQALASRYAPPHEQVHGSIRPSAAGQQVEIDLLLRCGNQVGIAEIKLGGAESGKRGLDQLKMAAEPTYLGTYAGQFLIVAASRLYGRAADLARERRVNVIYLPGYRRGQPLSRADADLLAAELRRALTPQPER
jgi:hypothetical protein